MELILNNVKLVITEYIKLHNYSRITGEKLLWNIEKFAQFLEYFKIKDFRNVEDFHYYQYIRYLKKKRGVSLITLKAYGMLLKKVFSILEEEEMILYDPFYHCKTVKCEKRIRDKILSEDEIRELLSIPDITNTTGFRNRTILELLYGTGIRARELSNLCLFDYLQDEKIIIVRNGKGNKDRILPLGERVNHFLLVYMKKVRKKLCRRKKRKYLFLNIKGEQLLTPQLWYIVKKTGEKLKVKKQISSHVLRHTFATHLLKNGAGIREVQLLLGHSCIGSTQIYINLTNTHLKEEYEKCHPLCNELFFDVESREVDVLKGLLKNTHMKFKKKLFDK